MLESDARAGIAGRARNLRHDVQRKISRLRQDRASSEAFPCSASSVESLPSGSGSSTQALVRAGSNHSSISCEDRDAISPTSIGPVLCRARALVDYTPSPYDKDVLKFKVRPCDNSFMAEISRGILCQSRQRRGARFIASNYPGNLYNWQRECHCYQVDFFAFKYFIDLKFQENSLFACISRGV